MADTKANKSNQHNVLFIAIDDLCGCPDAMNGETSVHTPNMNALAQKGVYFTNAHCAAPACNPSRVSVMTGLAPSTSGVYLNRQDWRKCKSLKDRITLPQYFKGKGYKTLGGCQFYRRHGWASISCTSKWTSRRKYYYCVVVRQWVSSGAKGALGEIRIVGADHAGTDDHRCAWRDCLGQGLQTGCQLARYLSHANRIVWRQNIRRFRWGESGPFAT